MKALRYFLLIFFSNFIIYAFSQRQNIKFEHLDINSGLSQNFIVCILQDSRGFMWFGTGDGLNKYDGYKFTVYKNDPKDEHSISNNCIQSIVEDSKGIIWIATRGGGLNRYDKEKDQFTHFKNDPKNPNSISSDLVPNLTKDSKGNLWLCTGDGALNYFDTDKKTFVRYKHDKNDDKSISENTRYVYEDSENNVWVGNDGGGLNLFNKKTKTFTHFRHNDHDSTSLSCDKIAVIYEDTKHHLWIGTVGGGLDLLDRKTGKFKCFKHDIKNPNSLPKDVVSAIGENNDGNLWIGTENGGLCIYNEVTGEFESYTHDDIDNQSISHNSIYSIYKDNNDNMWVGTFAGGINVFNKNANKFIHYKHTTNDNSLSYNNVLCMVENKNGKIWIGTDGGGLDLFDPVTKDFKHYVHSETNKKSICGNYVLSVLEDSKGNVWIGTWGDGITIYDPEKDTYRQLKNDPKDTCTLTTNNAWVIFEDREKNIWVGAFNGGLNLYNPSNNSFTRFADNSINPNTRNIHSITEDRDGKLWIATDGGGLQVFDKKTKTFTSYLHSDDKNSISGNRVTYTYQASDGNFWISTMTGLDYLDKKTGLFTSYTTSDGLPNNVIFGILEDGRKNLWISTNRGLSCFNPQTKQFKNFGIEDGLQSYEFKMRAFCKARSGGMYFGGINGFNEFFPDRIKIDPFEPPLVLTGFQIFNKNVPIAKDDNDPSPIKLDISEVKAITLPYKNSVISFEFASLNYTAQEKKKYAYMLENFDKNWNEIGTSRTATYTNLDPGEYTFKVKGLNNEGQWSGRTITVKLTITPPFWLTWWFKILAFLIVVGGAIGYYRYRVNAINKQKINLQQQVYKQTKQLLKSTEDEHNARREAEQANIDLERKNKELEQFAYVASHDLQEPLRTTSSFVGLIQKQYKGQLDDRADKYFNYILDASDRMKALIKNLLDYSRIGSKKDVERVDCKITLENVIADLHVAIEEANADIICMPLPVINGYPTEIKQLFQNLLINAIKFRKKDTIPQIKISANKIKNVWEFTFKDNGIGIAEEHREKIFNIFQRLHTRTEYEGSGIGLSYCKKIVELHNGKIWIESTPGVGTTFHFTIQEKNRSMVHEKVLDEVHA